MDVKLLITGCGRSGTAWISAVLRSLGFDVRHEGEGQHGTASWCLAAGDVPLPSWHKPVANSNWTTVLHQVREPLASIASLSTVRAGSYLWASRYVDIDPHALPLKRALRYWVKWNELAESLAVSTYRVEDIHHDTPRRNTRSAYPTSWEHLRAIDSRMAEEAIALASRYGYQV